MQLLVIPQSVLQQIHNLQVHNQPQSAVKCFLLQFAVSSLFLKVI
jgi:hypothetical protein